LLVAITIQLLLGQHDIRGADSSALVRDATKVANWPQWRGPNRDNRSDDIGLLQKWPDGGPPLSWRIDGLGHGISPIALVDGRAYTSTAYGADEFVVAFDEKTGRRLWATAIGPAVPESGIMTLMRWLSQRTPTVDGNRLYVFTYFGDLVCLNATSGDIVWRISYPTEFGTPRGPWGFCDRPLVDCDKLICAPGGVVALDKRTGKVIWKTLLSERFAFGSTLPVQTDGLKQYVVCVTTGIASFAAADGRLLWRYDRKVSGMMAAYNTYTPRIVEGGLLGPIGTNTGIARLKLTRKDDKVTAEEQYYRTVGLDAFQDSCMLVDGRLYAFRATGEVVCIDSSDGKQLWTARGSGSGTVAGTYADGRLYLRRADGTVALVEPSPKEYLETSHFQLPEPRASAIRTLPVVAGGRLYVRDNDRLYCYDVQQHPAGVPPPKPAVVEWTPPAYADTQPRKPGEGVSKSIFVPTPQDVVEKMLDAAHVGKEDVVYDLGSGDGRILIEAARKYQCKAIGVENDGDLVTLSRKRVEEAKLEKLVSIRKADLFATDFSDATVVTVYLFPDLLKRLMPKFEKLKPGTRIVSHQFEITGIPPEKTIVVESAETGAKHTVYLWTMPLRK